MQNSEMYIQGLIAVGELEKAQSVIQHLAPLAKDQTSQGYLQFRNDEVAAMMAEKKGDKQKALQLYDQFFAKYGQAIANSGEDFAAEFAILREHVEGLRKDLGSPPPKDSIALKHDTVKK